MSEASLQTGKAAIFDLAPNALSPVLSVTQDSEAIGQWAAEVGVARAAVSVTKRTAFSK